jgi:hypothetical protein
MFEILFIVGAIAWVVLTAFQWLATLAAFPTILAGMVLVPVLAVWSYGRTLRQLRVEFLRSRRGFLPPERFYWPEQARSLARVAAGLLAGAVVAWAVAIWWPASLVATGTSAVGWVAGLAAIGCSGLAMARWVVFFRGSQRFDALTPNIVGALRRGMFWLSDNYEFLGEEPEVPRKKKRESIY